MTYDEACGYVAGIPRFSKKNRPENTEELLGRLGHPEESFRVIHVAGTNGKGSVCAFLESILRETGFRTGLFTSPHLVDVRERFQIARVPASEADFLEAFQEVLSHVKDMEKEGFPHPAYFEFLFAMGMVIFRKEKIDVLVMETGLGGRLDATNTVKSPELTVITSISFDHMQYLGNTIPAIAGEKAGIIKKNVPVVADGFPRNAFNVGDALQVFEKKAREEEAPLTIVDEKMVSGIVHSQDGITFTLKNRYYDGVTVRIPFLADYQVENCATAMTAAAEFFDRTGSIPAEAVLRGVSKTRWAGRMEAVLPGVILDGAHNDDGISQFLKTARRLRRDHRLALLFTAVSDKDYEGMIRELSERDLFCFIITTSVGGPRQVPAEKLAAIFRRYTDVPVRASESVREAFSEAMAARGDGILLCAGSLYLVGEIEAMLPSEPGAEDRGGV